MERLAEARQFVEVETEKRRIKREAQERAELQFREGNKIRIVPNFVKNLTQIRCRDVC